MSSLSAACTGAAPNLLARLRKAGVGFVHGDISNREDFKPCGLIDTLIERSAEPSALAGYNSSPGYALNTNLPSMISCLKVARKNNARFVFLSRCTGCAPSSTAAVS